MFLTRSAIVGIALAGLPGSISAAPAQKVKAIVRSVEARYQSVRTLRATFLERYSENRRDVRVESGTVYFSRPGRMRWEYESPEAKFFLSDGKTVWFYVPADRTVTRARIRESSDWHTPLALLVGKARLSRFCGRVEFADTHVSAVGNVVLRCLPRSADANFREALLEVDGAYRLVRVLVREPAGVETEFRFANWQENVPLPEVFFHFQPPAGVAIVEESSLAGRVR